MTTADRELEPWEKYELLPAFVLDHMYLNADLERPQRDGYGISRREEVATAAQANLVTSLDRASGQHRPLLDLDLPTVLIPSTRPNHFHLYIDKLVPPQQYFKLLSVLAECGIIEAGFAGASDQRGYSALRVPWVKKEIAP